MAFWDPVEGETPIDPSELVDRSIQTRQQLNPAEAANIANAHEKYLAAKPTKRLVQWDIEWLCKLHAEMFGNVWKYAGKIRDRDLNLGVSHIIIRPELENLFLDLATWSKTGMDVVERATRIHHRAVFIHPFVGGNGRWSRLVSNIYLRANDAPLVVWPEQNISDHASPIRREYLDAIKAADKGNYRPLVALHQRLLQPPV